MRREPLVTLPPALTAPAAEARARGPEDRVGHTASRAGLGRVGARFVMGVDGGATKTLAAVLDVRERTLHLGHGASSNADAVGARAATESLVKATDEAIARAGIAREQLDAAVLAIAGTDTDAVAAHVRERRPKTWVVVNDVVGAWAAATGAQPGVGAISGTGSNVFGVGDAGGGLLPIPASGAPEAGATYWATRAAATGSPCSRSGPRSPTASAPGPRPR